MRPADMRTENERGGIKKLMAKTTFPANFKEKVDMSKVNMETMAPWIQSEVEKYVGFDDEVLVGYVQSQLVPPDGSPVDPRAVQINLMGFLEKHTSTFMKELCALALATTLARTLARTLSPTLTPGQPASESWRRPRVCAPGGASCSRRSATRWASLRSSSSASARRACTRAAHPRPPRAPCGPGRPPRTRPPRGAPARTARTPPRPPPEGARMGVGPGWAWGAVPLTCASHL